MRRRRRESIVFAMFDRARLIEAAEGTSTGAGRAGSVEVSVVGRLITGEYIYGADVIRIIRSGKQPRTGGRR